MKKGITFMTVIIAVVIMIIFVSTVTISSISILNDSTKNKFATEIAFIQEAAATIGPNQAVINLPYDGSLIAYGLTGLKSYYLERYGYEGAHETPESALIRTELSEISTRADVLEAVQDTGCRYVLILKRDKDIVYDFDPLLWQGISDIDDATPGFTPVLSEGDMRLYRIDAA